MHVHWLVSRSDGLLDVQIIMATLCPLFEQNVFTLVVKLNGHPFSTLIPLQNVAYSLQSG